MSRCLPRLLVVFVALLALAMTPLAATAAMDPRRSDCCEHSSHQTDHCSDCIVCVSGLSCVVPVTARLLPGDRPIVARLVWTARVGETRTEPPRLTPPRAPAGFRILSSSHNQQSILSS